ncbi:MAG: PhoX family phosphatase [Micropepsaceae bacterium]
MTNNARFSDLADRFLSRRALLKGGAAAAVLAATPLGRLAVTPARAAAPGFEELPFYPQDEPTHHVAAGHRADILISWGDPVLPGAPAFDAMAQSATAQSAQFGFNCDFIGYLPLKDGAADKAAHLASGESGHGLLCVNNEYSLPHLMFAGFPDSDAAKAGASIEQIAVEQASVGHSVIEVRRAGDAWQVVPDSRYARRFHATTPFAMHGPARGHKRLRTEADPDGMTTLGTFHNCAGGVTPWGTILSGEENVQGYFICDREALEATHPRETMSAASFDVKQTASWHRADRRFDMNAVPHEFNRFGWVIEVDPYDPAGTPKKRTALGRFRHEGATVVAENGVPVTVYMGDDQSLEHVYKFVSARPYVAGDPAANTDILDEGTLYAARFHDDGTGVWLRLVHGEGPLTAENGFDDQGDVVIDARRAARLLGATETDRPEDIETDPVTGRTYVAMTGGTERTAAVPAAPRAPNPYGHIVEILPPGEDGARDHTAETFAWDILFLAGEIDGEAEGKGVYADGVTRAGALVQPDNLVFDPSGRLWIATDGGKGIKAADGLWACAITGPERAVTRHFFSCPRGSEMTGPCFTPDGTTLFVSIQHPGHEKGASFDFPVSRWPAPADSAMPARPSVVAITREGGGPVGG